MREDQKEIIIKFDQIERIRKTESRRNDHKEGIRKKGPERKDPKEIC